MKKTLRIIGTLTACLMALFCMECAFAASAPVHVSLSGDSFAMPGETVTAEIEVKIDADSEVQGIQVNFDYSENFPELEGDSFAIKSNTTIWETAGISKITMLALGEVNPEKSELVGTVTFDIPEDAETGTQYVLTIAEVKGASADGAVETEIIKDKWTVTVGEKTSGDNSENADTDTGNASSGAGSSASGGDIGAGTPGGKSNAASDKTAAAEENTNESAAAEKNREWKNPFTDVKADDWFYGAVRYAVENGLFNGTGETTFSPEEKITRGMLTTVLYRIEGEPEVAVQSRFKDVEKGAYYEKAVIWAEQNKIVNGYTEIAFAPEDVLLREQIAAIIYRYAVYKGYDVSIGENTNILSYEDFDDISEYAIEAVQYAVGSGLINGKTKSTVNPNDNATRAEAAAILQRLIEK